MTDGGLESDSFILKKRYKRIGKALRQIDVIKKKCQQSSEYAVNDDQQAKLDREQELKEQLALIKTMAALDFDDRKAQLAKQNKKLNKKLKQIDDILARNPDLSLDQLKKVLNPDQLKKVEMRPQYLKQQEIYSDLLNALKSELDGESPLPTQTISAQTEASSQPPSPLKAGPPQAPPQKYAQQNGTEDKSEEAPPAEKPKEEAPQEMKSPETTDTPAYEEDQRSGSAPIDEEQSGSSSEEDQDDSGEHPTSDRDSSSQSSPGPDDPKQAAPSAGATMEYQAVMQPMRTVPNRPHSPPGSDSDSESEQQATAPAQPAQAQEEPETAPSSPPNASEDDADDDAASSKSGTDVPAAPLSSKSAGTDAARSKSPDDPQSPDDYVMVERADASGSQDGRESEEAQRERTEQLRQQARKNHAENKIAALKKSFWCDYQRDKLEPIDPWFQTPRIVRNILQFLHIHEAHKVASTNKTFNEALKSPDSYYSLPAVPACQFHSLLLAYPERYSKVKTIQCLRCMQHQLNDQSFWSAEVNKASALAIKLMAQTCRKLENVMFGYLSCPEMYQLLCANSKTLKTLQIYESSIVQPQGRIPDSLELPRLEEMTLVNSGFEYWQAVKNVKYLSYCHMVSISAQQVGVNEADITAIARNCRQLEAFELVYPPQSLSDQVIAEVVRTNQPTLRALHITCQPRIPQTPHRQLDPQLLNVILECDRLEILVIDGRLADHNIWILVDKLPRLRILEFSGAGVTENGVKMIVRHCGNLQLLSLTGCEPNAVQRIRESDETPDSLQVTAYPIVSSRQQPQSLKRYLEMRVPNLLGTMPSNLPVKTAPKPPTSQVVATVQQVPTTTQYEQQANAKPPGIPIPHGIAAEPTDFDLGKGITYSTPPAKDAPW